MHLKASKIMLPICLCSLLGLAVLGLWQGTGASGPQPYAGDAPSPGSLTGSELPATQDDMMHDLRREALALASTFVEKGKWLTYVHESAAFSICYPPNWAFREYKSADEGVIFTPAQPLKHRGPWSIGVSVYDLQSGEGVEDVAALRLESVSGNGKSLAAEGHLRLDGQRVIRMVTHQNVLGEMQAIAVKEGTLYTLWALPYDTQHPLFGPHLADLRSVFDEMMDCFHIGH